MLINLTNVLLEQHETLDEIFDLEAFEKPIHLIVEHIKDKELQIRAKTTLSMNLPCDRCLTEVAFPFEIKAYRHVDLKAWDSPLADDMDTSFFIKGFQLDLEQLIQSELLLNWPAKVLCEDDCLGLCEVCGANLNKNQGNCCEKEGKDLQMSPLKDIFQNIKLN